MPSSKLRRQADLVKGLGRGVRDSWRELPPDKKEMWIDRVERAITALQSRTGSSSTHHGRGSVTAFETPSGHAVPLDPHSPDGRARVLSYFEKLNELQSAGHVTPEEVDARKTRLFDLMRAQTPPTAVQLDADLANLMASHADAVEPLASAPDDTATGASPPRDWSSRDQDVPQVAPVSPSAGPSRGRLQARLRGELTRPAAEAWTELWIFFLNGEDFQSVHQFATEELKNLVFEHLRRAGRACRRVTGWRSSARR